jgi:hypothetical protein
MSKRRYMRWSRASGSTRQLVIQIVEGRVRKRLRQRVRRGFRGKCSPNELEAA